MLSLNWLINKFIKSNEINIPANARQFAEVFLCKTNKIQTFYLAALDIAFLGKDFNPSYSTFCYTPRLWTLQRTSWEYMC